MKINIRNIPAEGVAVSKDIDPKQGDLLLKDLRLLEAIQARLQLTKQGEDEVYVQGSVSSTLAVECSRCLKSFPLRLHSDFHLEYLPSAHVPSGGEHALSHESLDLHYYEGDEIDLEDELIGQLLLWVPMRPLCADDCRGLCARCGQDLNANPCACPAEPGDFRWSGLKNFQIKESNAKSKT